MDTIYSTLREYHAKDSIPHLIFHGPSGGGKKKMVAWFMKLLYGDSKDYVMSVNCVGKGINFIRETVIFFAQTHTPVVKSIVLNYADKLTIDAQSALRRCIELFSANTRFFIITTDKYRLMKPILSRFCEIYVPLPRLYPSVVSCARKRVFKRMMERSDRTDLATQFVDQGFSALDLCYYVEEADIDSLRKYTWIMIYHKIRHDFRNEELLLFVMLHFYFRKETAFNLFM